jgi:antitoxin VapB
MQTGVPPKAKLFQHGGSQAVRLPKEFRFDGSEVFVRRVGNDVVLSSQPRTSMRTLIDAVDEFESGMQLEREQPARTDDRKAISPKKRAR